jgi:hypothetical protein
MIIASYFLSSFLLFNANSAIILQLPVQLHYTYVLGTTSICIE